MASKGPEPTPKGGLWARLFSVQDEPSSAKKADPPAAPPHADAPAPEQEKTPELPPLSLSLDDKPAVNGVEEPIEVPEVLEMVEEVNVPEASEFVEPIEEVPLANVASPSSLVAPPASLPVAPPVPPALAKPVAVASAVAPPPKVALPPKKEVAPVQAPPAPTQSTGEEVCPGCGTKWTTGTSYCGDCGFMGAPTTKAAAGSPAAAPRTPAPVSSMRIKSQYELVELINERPGLSRFRGLDHGTGSPTPVMIIRGEVPEMSAMLIEEVEEVPVVPLEDEGDDFMPTFEEPAGAAPVAAVASSWPGIAWEQGLLENARHPSLPTVIDTFVEDNFEYLVEEVPAGRVLWDAWDDTDSDAAKRYGWLMQIAEALDALHKAGAIIEGIRPDLITVSDKNGQAVIADLSDLLPLPVPANAQMRGTLYTAPELMVNPTGADARADLYSFGAMLYSLEYLHHTLEEKDFERQFSPRLITDRYPDVHPGFFRLVCKTFVRDLNTRFPTDEASRVDKTGFQELIKTLDVCRRTFDNVRLDIAAWTTTGMVRTGNEDALGFMHAVESRQDELWEYALVTLCDGMGGYEAGEVAAMMAVAAMRKYLLEQPMFASVAGKEPPEDDVFSIEACKKALLASLKYANKEVHLAARQPGRGRRGMGCTAEAVYVDNRHVVVGHVGDSRTYHLHHGRLIQLTRDQTLVNRLVELGQLTEAEAEDHPRKNELQQAIGGQPDVDPGVYHGQLSRGDWVLVCSDGLTNHIPTADLEKMMTREAAGSAEEAARRLLNLVNLRGATDNATIVVIRVT